MRRISNSRYWRQRNRTRQGLPVTKLRGYSSQTANKRKICFFLSMRVVQLEHCCHHRWRIGDAWQCNYNNERIESRCEFVKCKCIFSQNLWWRHHRSCNVRLVENNQTFCDFNNGRICTRQFVLFTCKASRACLQDLSHPLVKKLWQ